MVSWIFWSFEQTDPHFSLNLNLYLLCHLDKFGLIFEDFLLNLMLWELGREIPIKIIEN